MGYIFRRLIAGLTLLFFLQLAVNVLISMTRLKSPPVIQSSNISSSGDVVTGNGRRLQKATKERSLWSLLGDSLPFFSMFVGDQALPLCPAVPSNLVGPLLNSYSLLSYEKLSEIHDTLRPGGIWRPANCTSRHSVALIVPIRERDDHLRIFLHNIHPFLQRQELDYGIYVVEQSSVSSFNRGLLMNIGFVESLRFSEYDCFIFHDVDLLPENDRNLYSCPAMPRHQSAAIDTFFYKLPYSSIFGGVEAFSKSHFELINGFSNQYFGWGGEDDDLYQRVIFHNLNLTRHPLSVARYRALKHLKMNPNPKRFLLLQNGPERFEEDGLSNLRYVLKAVERRKLYTRIYVEISKAILSPTWTNSPESTSGQEAS